MNRITHSLAALLLIAGLAGCSEEETLSGTPGDTRTPITITVTDGGYTPDDAARQSTAGSDIRQNADNRPSTRAVDNGYATTFTAGDQIGLYIVKSDGNGTSYAAENICLTLTDMGDGTSAWQAPAGTTLYYEGTAAKYFAYYPYQQTLPAVSNTPDAPDAPAEPVKPNASATDASGFFAPLISAWTPATDQGTHAAYTASDLMTGSGTIGAKQTGGTYSLELTMTHAMALVVIETPMTKYTLTDKDGKSLPDYCIPAPDTRFYGFTPCFIGDTYRYLVKPGQSGVADLMGSYTATGSDGSSSVTKEYAVSPNGITTANYALYKVDGATVTQKTHQLQVGDFYMNDGSLLAGSTATLTAAQKAACVGVVFWVGDATAKDKTLKADHESCTHGLVVALKNVIDNQTVWQNPYTSVQDWLNSNQSGKFLSVLSNTGANDPLNNIQGYNNTKAIEAFNDNYTDESYVVQAVQKVVDYRNQVPAPGSSSGWYLPSEKELSLLCGKEVNSIYSNVGTDMRDFLNGTNGPFQKLGDSATKLRLCFYWSSTESSYYYAFDVCFDDGGVGSNNKNDGNGYRVRCVLAF